eukprot:6200794-Pleurochrysis_carterae.AAC.2
MQFMCTPDYHACSQLYTISVPQSLRAIAGESIRAASRHMRKSVLAMGARLGSGVRMCLAQHVAASACVIACRKEACYDVDIFCKLHAAIWL